MKISIAIKIASVFIVCLTMAYLNYLLFHADDFISKVREDYFLIGSALFYLYVIFIFGQYFLMRKQYIAVTFWILLNVSFISNFCIWFSGITPSIFMQYSQSTSLLVFSFLLAFSKDSFPNWQRLFSLACLLILIPCLICFFSDLWLYYRITVYALCFTPVILSFVFLKSNYQDDPDLLDSI